MNKILKTSALAATLLLAGCAKSGGDSHGALVVSIEPQRAVLSALAEPGTDIVTLMSRGANPETFEPTLAQRASLDDAAIYFATGALPFEENIRSSAGNLRFIDTSAGINPVYGTHSHAHGHAHDEHEGEHHHEGEPDPHFWTSVEGTRVMARNMADALIAQDPENAEKYRARLSKLESRIDSVDTEVRTRLDGAHRKAFAVWHPSLSYFAREYGLKQVVVGQESKEMSVRQLRDVIESAKADSVEVFFFQKEYDSRQAESINREIGSRLVTIDPLDADWASQLIKIADELAR